MNFNSDEHALKTGYLVGLLVKHGIAVQVMMDDEGNYTDKVTIETDEFDDILIKVLP